MSMAPAGAGPKDKYYSVLGIICLLGISSLLPWNVLITQAEYLFVRAHQAPTSPWMADQIVTLTANSYLFMNLAAYVVLLPLGKHISLHTQIVLPLATAAGVVLLQAWIAVDTRIPGAWVLASTLASTAVLGAATAPLTSATYALASYLPAKYIQALVLGQSLAGVATSLLAFLTMAASASAASSMPSAADVRPAAVKYFACCAAVVLAGLAGYLALPRMPFLQHWTLLQERGSPRLGEGAGVPFLAHHAEDNVEAVIASMVTRCRASETRRILRRPSSQNLLAGAAAEPEVKLPELASSLRGYHYIVGLAFAVSLAGYPGIVSSICSVRNGAKALPCAVRPPAGRLFGDLFQPLLFLTFNAGDALGRALAGVRSGDAHPAALFAYGLLRALVVAGLAFCNVVASGAWRLPHRLWSDLWPASLVGLLGLTNGHLATIALMQAPHLAPSSARDRVSVLMSFSLTLGLAVGSAASIGLQVLLQS